MPRGKKLITPVFLRVIEEKGRTIKVGSKISRKELEKSGFRNYDNEAIGRCTIFRLNGIEIFWIEETEEVMGIYKVRDL